jgi:hypothetical protein
MNKKMLLPAIAVLVLLFSTPVASVTAENRQDKQQILLGVAQDWIAIGLAQYHRSFYRQAQASFLQAQGYQDYLTAAEQEKLSNSLEKIQIALVERKNITGHLQKADELLAKGELIKAKAHLKEVKNSEFLSREEYRQVAVKVKKLDSRIAGQTKEAADLYKLSVKYYRSGEIDKARQGFIQVAGKGLLTLPQGQTAEDYLIKIDNSLLAEAGLSKPTEIIVPEPTEKTALKPAEKITPEPIKTLPSIAIALDSSPKPVADPNDVSGAIVVEPSGRIAADSHRKKLLQSYAKAVINDALAKAQNYLNQGAFNKAKEVLEVAEDALNKNQLELGEALFTQYNSQLQQLTEQVGKEKTRWLGPWDTKTAWRL